MARRTTVQSKPRQLVHSSSHIAPGSPEYDRIFKGVQPPVQDDGSPQNAQILEEWRSFVVYHYLKHAEAEKKTGINSRTDDGKYYARLILAPRPSVSQRMTDAQGDVIMKIDPQAGPLPPTTMTTPRGLVTQSPVVRRGGSFLDLAKEGHGDSSVWAKESKRISRTMDSSRLAHIPCKARRKHISFIDYHLTAGERPSPMDQQPRREIENVKCF